MIPYFSFPWTFHSHRFYVLINYQNCKMMVSPHSSSGTGAGSLEPAPPRRTISPCIISHARSLFKVCHGLFLCVCLPGCCAFCDLVMCLYLCFLFAQWLLPSFVLLLYVTLPGDHYYVLFISSVPVYIHTSSLIPYFQVPFFLTVILSIKTALFL